MKTQDARVCALQRASGPQTFTLAGETGIRVAEFAHGGLWRFHFRAALGPFNAERLFITLPPTAWRPKPYRIGPVNSDFTPEGGNRVVLPMLECWINQRHYHNVWFDTPSPEDLQRGELEAYATVPVPSADAVVEFRLIDPIELQEMTVEIDERHALLEDARVKFAACDAAEKHPRMFLDEASLPRARERAQTTHKREWERIRNLLEERLEQPVQERPLRNEDGMEHLDAPNRLVLYAFGYLMTEDERYFRAAWHVAESVYLHETRWPPGRPADSSFMTHYGVDNDMAQGHTALNAMALFFDWCHRGMSNAQRDEAAKKLAHHADLIHRQSILQLSEWASQHLNSHHVGSMCGLQMAGLALLGRDPRALEWALWGRAVLEKTLRYISTDGAYSFGGPANFQVYFTPILWQCELWRQWSGEDLFQRLPLRAITDWRLFRTQNTGAEFLTGGYYTKDRWMFLQIAKETGYEPAQWIASQLAEKPIAGVVRVLAARLVWQFLFRDPAVKSAPPQLPVSRVFGELDRFVARSHWKIPDDGGWLFQIGCTQPMSRSGRREFNPRANYHFHAPAHGHYSLCVGGETLVNEMMFGYRMETAAANCVTIDGIGQNGDGAWLGPKVGEEQLGRIVSHTESPSAGTLPFGLQATHVERVEFDLSGCYPEHAGVRKYLRSASVYRDARGIVAIAISDKISTAAARTFKNHLHTSGSLEAASADGWRIARKNKSVRLILECAEPHASGVAETELVRGYVPPPKDDPGVRHLWWRNAQPRTEFSSTIWLCATLD